MSESTTTAGTRTRGSRLSHLVAGVGPRGRLALTAIAALMLVAYYVFANLPRAWQYVLPLRATQVGGMVVVAVAIGVSTVLFQTVTDNRILTPALMGFDAMFVLIQTVVVFAWGSAALATSGLGETALRFVVEAGLMSAFALALFLWMFRAGRSDVHLLLLVGIVFGVLFRSISSMLQRLIDPGEYQVLQDVMFASFTAVDRTMLTVAAVVTLVCLVIVWRLRRVLDVMSLGRAPSVNLGLDHRRLTLLVLVIVAVLVSVSTALVGPVTFFGLLVAHVAYQLMGSSRHSLTLPAASVVGVVALVGGQLLLKNVFAFDTGLSVVIEFFGGVVFIVLLLRGARA